jgi:hypothetical protein
MSTIPSFYRIFFATLDPLLAGTGILTAWLFPRTFLLSYFPDPRIIAPETRFTLDAIAGFFASTLLLQVYLLRIRPTDIGVWKAVQASIVIQDFAFLLAFQRVKAKGGDSSPTKWTLEEWGNLVILVGVATIRLAFLAGVGLGNGKGARKSK